MGSCVEGAIPLAVVGLNRRTNSFVMCGSSALGHGGTSATAMRCWHFAAPSITVPSIGYLNAIDSDFERRKNHRMLLTETREATITHEFLANYNGILVSDFYPVYDSVRCKQQKCWVHLIRDLN